MRNIMIFAAIMAGLGTITPASGFVAPWHGIVIGMIAGLVFLVSSLVYSSISAGTVEAFTARNVLICLMLTITLISQFGIVPRMDGLRASLGEMSSAPADSLARIQFDALHAWSTRLESAVLLLGLVVLYLVAARS